MSDTQIYCIYTFFVKAVRDTIGIIKTIWRRVDCRETLKKRTPEKNLRF